MIVLAKRNIHISILIFFLFINCSSSFIEVSSETKNYIILSKEKYIVTENKSFNTDINSAYFQIYTINELYKIFEGAIKVKRNENGDIIFTGDFTFLKRPGNYFLVVDRYKSLPFQITK